uniref:Acetylglutamate kinase n=1 Tax=Dasyclonium flaccidum TaxID=2007274 RepID=A0A1Z1MKV0_9FLOR|nr:acetylglutamate kinase [Dasyclonium flaccidum]ARW66703.1 acetylglutamate kinase [Dasyclonium flaccidum]
MSNLLINNRFFFLDDLLPFIKRYSGSTFVVKYGGSIMEDNSLKFSVIKDICFLHSLGINLVIVHGGGVIINYWLNKLNIEPMFKDGVRITDHETMQVVEMVLSGKINKDLVSLLNNNNTLSIGLSGKDLNFIQASPLFDSIDNLAGKVDTISIDLLNLFLSKKIIPVIASIACGKDGKTYNINADTVASAVASSLQADKLILLTDTLGVLTDINDQSTLVKDLNLSTVKKLQSMKVISGGMIPKIQCCINALKSNVKSTHIIDGRIKNSLLYEVLTSERIGSMIVL